MMKMRTVIIALVAALIVLPWLLNDYQLHVLIVGFYYSMLVLAWGFLAGKAGVFSLGIHALAGLAAYTSALAVTYYRLPFIITMPLGVLVAVAISFSLAALTLKMKGIYLALTTWAFAEISRLLISALYEITRGDLGLQTPTLFGLRVLAPYYYLFLLATASTGAFLYRFSKSVYGYFIWSVGQDAILCSVSGINVYRWRIVATIISGTIAGVAGVLFGHYIGVLAPSMLGFQEMATIIMMSIVGGYGSVLGAYIGAILVNALMEGFRIYAEWRLVAFAATVILMVRFYREGVIGLLRKYYPTIVKGV